MEITISFEVTFNRPDLNHTITFKRHKSPYFDYGNKSCITIMKNGKLWETVDTRYDPSVMRDFEKWCTNWMEGYYCKDLEPKWSKK